MPSAKPITPGDRFGRWTVLEKTEKRIFPSESWILYHECRCDCGTIKLVTRTNLLNGQSKSCGCSVLDIAAIKPGERFGRWVSLSESGIRIIQTTGKRVYLHECRCDCGTVRFVANFRLRSGQTLSCGCLRDEVARKTNRVHGYHRTPIYRAWAQMIERCTNPKLTSYKNYGGRGIAVCDRWLNFANFLEDMGERPDGRSLDRLDNNGPYSPENCGWRTRKQQARNRRTTIFVTFGSETMSLTDWAEKLNLSYAMLKERYHQGWSVEQILTRPPQKRKDSRSGPLTI